MPLINFAKLETNFSGALICSATRPADYSIMACNMGCNATLNLYAEGRNSVNIDENCLVLTKLNVGKENWLSHASGQPNYKMSSFADTKENGTLTEWDIQLKSGLTTLAGNVSLQDTLDAYTGSGSPTK